MSELVLNDNRFSVHGDTLVASEGYFGDGIAIIPDADEYYPDNSLVPSYHRCKPKFMRFLQMTLSPLYAAMDAFTHLEQHFDIDNAEGQQLDTIGRLLGCSRVLPVVFQGYSRTLDDDEDYRLYIKAAIANQHWDGTLSGMVSIISDLFPAFDLQIVDNQDCSVNVKFNSLRQITGVQMQMILNGLLFPAAAGVKMYVEIPATIETANIGINAGVYQIWHDTVGSAGVQ